MDPNLTLIFAFILVALVITMCAVYVFQTTEAKHKERRLELEARIEEAKAQQAALPNVVQADLEDRLRVLERIVTDPSSDLSRQIENLREKKLEAS